MPNLVFGMQPFPLNPKKKLKVAGLCRAVTKCVCVCVCGLSVVFSCHGRKDWR